MMIINKFNSSSPALIVSACLLGEKCRYDGKNCFSPSLKTSLSGFTVIPVCPEIAGGLPVPRYPAEISGGDGRTVLNGQATVRNQQGEDVTAAFLNGAKKTLEIARKNLVTTAILKDKSPSCGKNYIYDGSFRGRLRPGPGVTAALLEGHGITIYSEPEWMAKER